MDGTRNYSSMHQITKTGAWLKDDAGKSGLRRKLFGRAPWVRKESGDSFSSVTSSVREILKGETPPPSLGSSYSSCMFISTHDYQDLNTNLKQYTSIVLMTNSREGYVLAKSKKL
jgi:hypothetical protein